MKTSILVAALIVVAGSGLAIAVKRDLPSPETHDHARTRTPVLVELFTSEGCSSCPPADELLAKLQKEQPVDGALIIAMSEHVDYWNSASWSDRFSSPLFSNRQGNYVNSLHAQSPYTPQMVVQGRSEFVGSDEGAAINSIAAAARLSQAHIQSSISPAPDGGLTVRVGIDGASGLEGGQVMVAITENNLENAVRGGENGGRELHHTAVVRSMRRIGSVDGSHPFQFNGRLDVAPRWKAKDLSVVTFIQSSSDGRILGCSIASPNRA